MRVITTIFTNFLCAVCICTAAMGRDPRCTNSQYRATHPDECADNHSTGLIWTGAGLVAGAAAVAAMASGGGGGGASNGAPATMPTMPTYTHVGGDIDARTLAGIMDDKKYTENLAQYNDIRLAYSLARGYTGRGTRIAVIDGATWHGAAVTDIAGGAIAPNATVQHYHITDRAGKFMSYAQIAQTISAADANVYNFSWNSEMRATALTGAAQLGRLTAPEFTAAMHDAAARDAIMVWAAGNDYATQSGALSAMPQVIPELRGHFVNVVAWDSAAGRLSEYSNQCGITQDWCITAPGDNITATVDDTPISVSGTSFAAPTVAAAIAVLREAYPYMTAPQITTLLFETARDLGAPGVDAVYGHGMLDLERATRPVGAPLVPVSSGMMQPLRTAHAPGAIAARIKSADLKFAYFDRFGRPYQAALNDNIRIRNIGRGFSRLTGDKPMSMTIGAVELGFRRNEVLPADGMLTMGPPNTMAYVGASTDNRIGRVRVSSRTRLGLTGARKSSDSMVTNLSRVYTLHTSVTGQYGDIAAGIAIPDTIIRGNMHLRMASGRAPNGDITFETYRLSMTTRPSVEYTLGYKSVTMGFVDNPYGTDEVYILARRNFVF